MISKILIVPNNNFILCYLQTKMKIVINSRAKRSSNGNPTWLFVELLLVTDRTIFLDHQSFLQTNDTDLVFLNMKIYYSHFFNGVSSSF